jgi:hypothetical protein
MRRISAQDMRKTYHQGFNLEKFLPVRQVLFESRDQVKKQPRKTEGQRGVLAEN